MIRLPLPALGAMLVMPIALMAGPALAQAMPGMAMPVAAPPAKPAAPPPPRPAQPAQDPHAGHTMPQPAAQPGEPDPMPAMDAPGADAAHEGHDGAEMQPEAGETGNVPAPPPPTDHAADALFDPADMARSRQALRREHGAFSGSMVLFDLAEYRARRGGDGYRWEGEAWFGGDIDRLLVKTEGEGTFGKPIDDVEVQALYSRAISPFWNAHVGVRHDIVPNPSRTYVVAGVEGIAPYWFHVTGQLFVSDRGDLHARLEASYDERITQRLILQPRAEFNFAAQDVPAIGVGSGLSTYELGARLRYEIRKELAPYVGLEWSGRTGGTARLARLAGDKPDVVNFVAGIRFWF